WTGDTEYLNNTSSASATVRMPAKAVSLTANFRDITAITEIYDNGLKIYPNPARNKMIVEFDNPRNERLKIRLININGQIVAEKSIVSQGKVETDIDLSGLSPGLYTLKISGDRLNATRKLIIKP
ncbi:MAG: T9SS type A sorting domain-containing protein, partial [Bacteroidales bacterium]|nr:T9SS type A sorting domain-containing protein [Bacteroidales bacterium]